MKFTKFLLLLSFSSILFISCKENKQEDVRKIQIGFTTAAIDTDPYYIFAKNFSEIVEEKTNGRIKIEVKHRKNGPANYWLSCAKLQLFVC